MKLFNKTKEFDHKDSQAKYQATCAACGNACEVPFRPSGDKPVYCNDCFKNRRQQQQGPRRDFNRPGGRDRDKRMYQATCAKCGNKCEVPFRPSGDKPVYCSNCFSKGSSSSSPKAPDQTRQQFEILNAKLDKILQALNPTASLPAAKEVKKALATKESKKSKPAAKKLKTKKRK
ncbi:MAG: CxxC-x17-CxxC domain-containing protein [Patescibacteria group bacterium]|jgi:CxxC-x17-CxxC domain-containing protein